MSDLKKKGVVPKYAEFFQFSRQREYTIFWWHGFQNFLHPQLGQVAKTGFQQARSNTGLNVFKDDLTVWILPNHPNMVLYHNMLIVSIFKIERVDHFLVAWLLECSAPSAGCHHRTDTTLRRYEAGRYKDEAGIRTYISS